MDIIGRSYMFVTSGSLRLNTLDPIPLWDLQLARRENWEQLQ